MQESSKSDFRKVPDSTSPTSPLEAGNTNSSHSQAQTDPFNPNEVPDPTSPSEGALTNASGESQAELFELPAEEDDGREPPLWYR